jgi:uncharacterized membrane protein YgcG
MSPGFPTSSGWRQLDQNYLKPLAMITIVVPLYVYSVIQGWNESPIEEIFGGRRNFSIFLILIVPISYGYLLGLFLSRRGKWVKMYEVGHREVEAKVETVLKRNKLPYRKMTLEGPLPQFPIRYVEGFTIDNGRIIVRIQDVLDDASILEIGTGNGEGHGKGKRGGGGGKSGGGRGTIIPGEEKDIETLGVDVLREKIDRAVQRSN